MDVIIDENEIKVPVEISTWGDLLDWLETDYLKSGQCIMHVYLNGNEALNYRHSDVCREEITNVTPVAIKSGDFDKVLSDSMSELDHELKASLALSIEIVHLLENRKEEEAYLRLGQLLDSIRIFFTIFSEDLGWAETPNAEISRTEISATLEKALTQLVAAQEKHYWVQICDVLEYEIVPVLESWQKLVNKTREHIS
jgi:hypothetical protein